MQQLLWLYKEIEQVTSISPQKIGCGDFGSHQHKRFKRGDFVYVPEDESDRIFLLIEGQVKIGAYGPSGKEITKAILNKGEVFGELALLEEGSRRDFAFVMESCILCVLETKDLKQRINHSLNYNLMKIVGARLLDMEKRLESMSFKNSRTRIIDFLLDLVAKKGHQVGFEVEVRKFITHQEIANLTSTSRQTVTTLLNDLRARNILTFDRRRLLVRDLPELRQQAKLLLD